MEILIIGCGAAGAAAAIAAALRGDRVTVIDRNRKPLKKLGVTGNGRGNLMNGGPLRYYGDTAFAHRVLANVTPADVADFLTGCGITLVEEDEGRMYPAANLASVAVDALLARMERLGVRILPCTAVKEIHPINRGFTVAATATEYAPDQIKASGKVKKGEAIGQRQITLRADRVIVAAGGAAAPAHGTDGSAYALLTSLGHTLHVPKPALCALLTDAKSIKGLSGKRVRAALTLTTADGRLLHQSSGEALFADDGVSGIAAMQLARFVEPGCLLHMDLRQAVMGDGEVDVCAWLKKRRERLFPASGAEIPAACKADTVSHRLPTLTDLMTGCAHPGLQTALLRMAGLSQQEAAMEETLRGLAAAMEDFVLPVTGVRDFDQAQVTAGGLDTAQFDPNTMESRLIPGLYAAGEMLDVDGDCGGYNLMFAFAGGLLAGRSYSGC